MISSLRHSVGRDDAPALSAAIVNRVLSLAAAPTFAAMAVVTAMRHGGAPDMLCSPEGASPLAGMVPMYLLMTAFHIPPWLTLLSRRKPLTSRRG